jgi:hypothetical protein
MWISSGSLLTGDGTASMARQKRAAGFAGQSPTRWLVLMP